MPRTRQTDAIERTFSHAWIEHDMIPDEEQEARRHTFQECWGGFETEAFKHALQEGNEADRLVALFALGYLAYEETHDLLVPFLTSAVRKECWASAIVLGAHQDEQAFALLGQLLKDQLEPFSPPADEERVRNVVRQAGNQARELYSSPAAWERFVHPGLYQTWRELEAYCDDYTWHMRHRQTITSLLGVWNDPRAIFMLRQALQTCWHVESRTRRGSLQLLHQLEDRLVLTLGQLEAWNALEELEMAGLPPSRFKLARVLLVLGALRVKLPPWFKGDIQQLIQIGTIDAEQVTKVLQERFGLDDSLARANLKMFQQWYQERDELWQWQRSLERGEADGLSWPPQPPRGEWITPRARKKPGEIQSTSPGEQRPSGGLVIRKRP